MNDTVLLNIEGGIAHLTLNRPHIMNTFDQAMADALQETVGSLADNNDVRCVVLQGAGENFMAGGDIQYFAQSLTLSEAEREQRVHAIINQLHEAIQNLRQLPMPVIASVQGAVAGVGMSLMLHSDLVVAADNTQIAPAYNQVGLSPDGGFSFALPRCIGEKRAKAIAFLGESLDAQTALELGLINQVVPVAELEAVTQKLAKRLCFAPKEALARTKLLLNQSFERDLQEQLRAEQKSFVQCTLGPEFAEGVQAFLEKRRPSF